MSPQDSVMSSSRSKITPEREQEFYAAVLELLRECGYDALTMEGVASRSRCGKSTLYRQWGNKPQLVACALRGTRGGHLVSIDTGTLAGDLRETAKALGAQSGRDTPLMHALSHAALQNPELLEAIREGLVEPAAAAIDTMVARAVARGEVAADNPAVEFVAAQLMGAMRVRPMLEGRYGDTEYLVRFVESAVLPVLLRTDSART
ncbi:TetR/AcrR family transcriptional regulator [Streptomyces sp. NBC_01387]|uniref:TetR/AcrR family transcriptional regulator n=1 Tax=unclassified Streptomyces TaxID=2593676 RepID=UPI002023D5B5|nr:MULTISPECIES: TetR/AcrR family transcriptional regulator [unclassified Streptomyces]MCX4553849.1 TetR/AcrR family transcriptional regulator [Streptomyces sp. NBC_01500]WSC18762.1 TetR/AcrR family transcriptional regulator [Streptomyces sp. NBC_01766]WSV52797.1 TetR/AcrR family transcriptional regulator [Streptomyces sp. NBC_01014]